MATLFNHYSMSSGPKKAAYNPVRRRRYWSSSRLDFFCGCFASTLGTLAFSELPVYVLLFGGVYILPAFLFGVLLFVLPQLSLQTFLGQFSNSGFISALRFAPYCQGLGYSFLLLNFICLTFTTLWAAMPLVYAYYALHPSLSWMHCNNIWNTQNCSTLLNHDEETTIHASVEFFRFLTHSAEGEEDFSISWTLAVAVASVWLITLLINLTSVEFIGKFLRYSSGVGLALFLAIFVNLLINVEDNWSLISTGILRPTLQSPATIWSGVRSAFLLPIWILGPGCATVLTLASHNRFGVRSDKIIYGLGAFHVLLVLPVFITGRIALDHFEDHVGLFHYHVEEGHNLQFIYLCYSFLLGNLPKWPNLWSFIFFALIFLSEFSAIVVQCLSIKNALLDKFPVLHQGRTRINLLLVLVLLSASISIIYITKFGFGYLLQQLPLLATLIHLVLLLLLLFTVLCFYRRNCLERDYKIMYGESPPSGSLYILCFVTPLCLLGNIVYLQMQQENTDEMLIIVVQSVVYAIVPGYAIVLLYRKRTSGCCFRSADWRPLNENDQCRYLQAVGNIEMFVLHNSEGPL